MYPINLMIGPELHEILNEIPFIGAIFSISDKKNVANEDIESLEPLTKLESR